MNAPGKYSKLPPRPETGGLIAGVCVALGTHLGLDVTLIRIAFVLLGLAWGIGLILYGLLWVLMPGPDGTSMNFSEDFFYRTARGMRMNFGHSAKWFSKSRQRLTNNSLSGPQSRRWTAVALLTAGAAIFLASLGAFDWLSATRAFGLAIVSLGISLIVTTRKKG